MLITLWSPTSLLAVLWLADLTTDIVLCGKFPVLSVLVSSLVTTVYERQVSELLCRT